MLEPRTGQASMVLRQDISPEEDSDTVRNDMESLEGLNEKVEVTEGGLSIVPEGMMAALQT